MNAVTKPSFGAYDIVDHTYDVVVVGAGGSGLLGPTRTQWTSAVLVLGTLAFMLRTRFSPLWPIAIGALAGMLGWI